MCLQNFFAPNSTVEMWKSIQSKVVNCVKIILDMIVGSTNLLSLCIALIHSSQLKNKEMNPFFAKQRVLENLMFSYLLWITGLSKYQTVYMQKEKLCFHSTNY